MRVQNVQPNTIQIPEFLRIHFGHFPSFSPIKADPLGHVSAQAFQRGKDAAQLDALEMCRSGLTQVRPTGRGDGWFSSWKIHGKSMDVDDLDDWVPS